MRMKHRGRQSDSDVDSDSKPKRGRGARGGVPRASRRDAKRRQSSDRRDPVSSDGDSSKAGSDDDDSGSVVSSDDDDSGSAVSSDDDDSGSAVSSDDDDSGSAVSDDDSGSKDEGSSEAGSEAESQSGSARGDPFGGATDKHSILLVPKPFHKRLGKGSVLGKIKTESGALVSLPDAGYPNSRVVTLVGSPGAVKAARRMCSEAVGAPLGGAGALLHTAKFKWVPAPKKELLSREKGKIEAATGCALEVGKGDKAIEAEGTSAAITKAAKMIAEKTGARAPKSLGATPVEGQVPAASKAAGTEAHFFSSESGSSSPESLERLCGLLRGAEATLDIAIYNLTDDRIKSAILFAAAKGVRIRIVTEGENVEQKGNDVKELSPHMKIVQNTLPHLMHHKYAVIDKNAVVTGSFNWTKSAAEQNDENIVILTDRAIIKKFQANFDKCFKRYSDPANPKEKKKKHFD